MHAMHVCEPSHPVNAPQVVTRLFALHAAAHPDNRLPPPGVNMPDVNWLTDSESESDSDYMTETMWDIWVD